MEQIGQGLPLIRIATLIDRPLSCVAVLKNSSIQSLQDLKGKQIGYSAGGITELALKTMLEKHGVNLSDIHMINVHYALTQALLSHNIAAVTGMMRTFEVIQLDLAGKPARIFLPEENGVPPYDELVLVINKNHIHDKRFPRFIAALQKGENYLQKHPNESWQLFVKSHPELNDQLNQRAWYATLAYFAKNPAQYNAMQWQIFAHFAQKNGLIPTALPVENYAVILRT